MARGLACGDHKRAERFERSDFSCVAQPSAAVCQALAEGSSSGQDGSKRSTCQANGNGNEGEHGPEAEQSVDDALVALVATIGEGTCGIVDTVRGVTSRGAPGRSRLSAGIQFGGNRPGDA